MNELDKYSRQILIRQIGNKQEKLMKSKTAIIGLGALGTNTANLLARAGVENLVLVDGDRIEESNLQRQTLFTEKDVGRLKAEAAKEKLNEINSKVKVKINKVFLSENNVSLLDDADLIIDCTDNMEARFVLNKYCLEQKKTWIFSSAVKTSGYVMPILPDGPCLGCFLKEAMLDSACTVGVLNTIAASISALASTLAVKILVGEHFEQELYYYNIWTPELKKMKVKKKEGCEYCG